jgi:hypothetical protein
LVTLDRFGIDSLEGAGGAMLFSALPAYEQTLDLGALPPQRHRIPNNIRARCLSSSVRRQRRLAQGVPFATAMKSQFHDAGSFASVGTMQSAEFGNQRHLPFRERDRSCDVLQSSSSDQDTTHNQQMRIHPSFRPNHT